MGHMRNADKILVRKPGRKTPLRITKHWKEDNIRLDLREIGVDWIHVAQNKYQRWVLVNMVMNL